MLESESSFTVVSVQGYISAHDGKVIVAIPLPDGSARFELKLNPEDADHMSWEISQAAQRAGGDPAPPRFYFTGSQFETIIENFELVVMHLENLSTANPGVIFTARRFLDHLRQSRLTVKDDLIMCQNRESNQHAGEDLAYTKQTTEEKRKNASERPITGQCAELSVAVRRLMGWDVLSDRPFLTVREAAYKTGVSYSTVAAMTRGERPAADSIGRFAEGLGGDPNHLLQLAGYISETCARSGIFAEITVERERQDAQWGGPEHDDRLSTSAWPDFITDFADKAENAENDDEYRRRMVQIAALAVAAIESLDRYHAKN